MDYFNFPPDDNRHLMHIETQVGKMKEGDSKHIEVDDVFNIFLKCDGSKKYTGWIYYVQGAMPAMTFESATLKQIIADAYEQHIFTNETAGSMYNRFQTQDLQAQVDEEIKKELAYAEEAKRNSDHEYRSDYDVGTSVPVNSIPEVVSAINPMSAVTIEDTGNGMIMIRILKSIAAELVDKYPELNAQELVELLKDRSSKYGEGKNVDL